MTVRTNYPGVKADGTDSGTQQALVINRLLAGRRNVTFDVTLRASQTTTTVTDPRIQAKSIIDLMPVTANARTAKPNCYFTVTPGQVVINHASSANVDQTFVGRIDS